MDVSQLRSHLVDLGVRRTTTIVARRAAGVWTLLPSLAYQNLTDLDEQATVLLMDFGLRYEMLAHLKVNALTLPNQYSFLGLAALLDTDLSHSEDLTLLEYYRDIVAPSTRIVQFLPDVRTPERPYVELLSALHEQGKCLLLCPFDSGPFGASPRSTSVDLSTLARSLQAIAQTTRPDLIYLTFEGQPERPIFDEKLKTDLTMRFCLDLCDNVLSLVRTDSMTRFEEGIAIPLLLAENDLWEPKIRLFLTRHPQDASVPEALDDIVIGQSPFLDMIGQSIHSGRIPWVDFMTRQYDETRQSTIERYFRGLRKASRSITDG